MSDSQQNLREFFGTRNFWSLGKTIKITQTDPDSDLVVWQKMCGSCWHVIKKVAPLSSKNKKTLLLLRLTNHNNGGTS